MWFTSRLAGSTKQLRQPRPATPLRAEVLESRLVPTVQFTPVDNPLDPAAGVAVVRLASATEGGDPAVFQFTRTGDTSLPLTAGYSVSGMATAGDDFTPFDGPVTFDPGVTTVTLTVPLLDDLDAEATETITVTVQTAVPYDPTDGATATADVLDNEPATVSVAAVPDGTGGEVFQITRLGEVSTDVTMQYSAASPDAGTPVTGTVMLVAGMTVADFPVTTVLDGGTEWGTTLQLTIEPGTGYVVGATDTATIDVSAAGTGDFLSAESDAAWADEWDTACGEPPPSPPPAPPAAPPTGATLEWTHFREVETAPIAGEDAMVAYRRLNFGRAVYDISDVARIDGMYYALQPASVAAVTYKVQFNAAESWVVRGKQDPTLLEHERTHLKIAEYVAQKIAAKYPSYQVMGGGIAFTREEALASARRDATRQLQDKFNAVLATWAGIDNAVQTRYDDETKHGTDGIIQATWNMGYKEEVDKEFNPN